MKNSIQNFQKSFSAIEHLRLFQLWKKNKLNFIRSFSLRFCWVAILSFLVFTGCESDSDVLLQEEERTNEQYIEVNLSSSNSLSDGANGGPEGFYFLPPMVKAPNYSGTFNANLSPVIDICETTECLSIHASFSMDDGEGSELVRLVEEDGHYVVNWHTDKTGTEVGQTYRIRVSVAGTVLGHADVQMAGNGKDAKNITDGEAIALVDGRTLPIKFRIEEGAIYLIGSDGGTFSTNDGLVNLEIPANAIDEEIGITIEPVSDPSMDEKMVQDLIFEFGPSGTQFAEPVIVTIQYDLATLPSGIDEELLSIHKYLDGEWVNIDGSTVDIVNKTVQASLSSFSLYGVGERELEPIPELTGVDGYIHRLSESDQRYRVSFAVDGVPTGGVYCCPSTLEAALNAYPDRNLVYLPEATDDDIDTGIVPPLAGVDGYIEHLDDGTGRFIIRFAIDGFPTGGAACCPSSVEEARSWYPDRNLIFLSPSPEVIDLSWNTMGGAQNTVAALLEYEGALVAGGGFTTIGGISANRIARWDGSQWHAMGSFSHVSALAEYNGELIAGGNFGISRWNGANWQAMSTTSNHVALTVYNGELISGGWFTSTDGVPANRVAGWDGTQWRALGSGMNGPVFSLTVYNGELIAGGNFTTADGASANYIARWDGTQWHPMDSGMSNLVLSLTVYNGELIAGGRFETAGGVTANYIARWDGVQWQSIGDGMNGYVLSLNAFNNELVVGGEFTTADGEEANRIARWDGVQWYPMGNGMDDGSVRSLTEYEQELVAGGTFVIADGKTVNRIARWGTP
jgi:hypothetical protein